MCVCVSPAVHGDVLCSWGSNPSSIHHSSAHTADVTDHVLREERVKDLPLKHKRVCFVLFFILLQASMSGWGKRDVHLKMVLYAYTILFPGGSFSGLFRLSLTCCDTCPNDFDQQYSCQGQLRVCIQWNKIEWRKKEKKNDRKNCALRYQSNEKQCRQHE